MTDRIADGTVVRHNRYGEMIFVVDQQDYEFPDRCWLKDPWNGYMNARYSDLTA